MHPRIAALTGLGQSLWVDYLSRETVTSGTLARWVEQGVRGVTSNPAIFEQAIGHSDAYDAAIAEGVRQGQRVDALYDALTVADVQAAADVLRPVYDATGGQDGYVSLEVAPRLAHDTGGTIEEATRLFHTVGRPNVMIKVPATPEGLPAVRALIRAGIHINVTLIFGVAQYQAVWEAFVAGLEDRVALGEPVDRIASVASFFISRVDTWVDRWLVTHGGDATWAGRAAIAQAKVAYQAFLAGRAHPRFQALEARGAAPQRPLWASTSTKNPAYSDVRYVDGLIGPTTVNTVPPTTLEAWLDHGQAAPTLTAEVEAARAFLQRLEAAGLSLDAVAEVLLADGVEQFARAFDSLRRELGHKRAQLINRMAPDRWAVGSAEPALAQVAAALTDEAAVERIWRREADWWSADPAHQAVVANALGWLEVPAWTRSQLPALRAVAAEVAAEGYTDCVVLGMGGSSLVSEVLRHAFPVRPDRLRVHVLDSTHPAAVSGLLGRLALERTLFCVASKSGTTTEAQAFYHAAWAAVAARTPNPGRHFIAITDPGTPLAEEAAHRGFRACWLNPVDIGGRYSALSLFGMGPAVLAGWDAESLLDRAAAMQAACREKTVTANPGAWLGVALGTLARSGRDKVTVVLPARIAWLADWIEQLLAESTGKGGTGLIPIVHEPLGPAAAYGPDRLFVVYHWYGERDATVERWAAAWEAAGHPVLHLTVADRESLGAEFFRWEFATAVAGRLLGINPFDQPNVQESKEQTARMLQSAAPPDLPGLTVTDGGWRWTALHAEAAADPGQALRKWLRQVGTGEWVAWQAYLEPTANHWDRLQALREAWLTHWHRPSTLGFGPRFLHSTGQLHKGGTPSGWYLQLVEPLPDGPPIPDMGYDFGRLLRAQADGDYLALAARGRRVARLWLPAPAATALDQVRQWLEAGPDTP